ncbi:MAG: PDZ domain-containing protein [Micrococcaceae bacterium]
MAIKKSAAIAIGSALVLSLMPLPYVIEYPGPSYNTLGKVEGHQLITIDGHKTQATNGHLDMVTVRVRGGPGSYVNAVDVVAAWLNPNWTVNPTISFYPTSYSSDDAEKEAQADMASSQDMAFAAALGNLGIPYQQNITVSDIPTKSPSVGKIQKGDRLLKVNGIPVTSIKQFRGELAKMPAGKAAVVTVVRAGHEVTERIVPTRVEGEDPVIGILATVQFVFPFKAKIQIDNVGGPSAGMMFALGIIDKIGNDNLTNGKYIMGTGVVTQDGDVAPIGGIRQKMITAKRNGAGLFLAPSGNCNEVVGHIPEGLKVVKVATLAEAKNAVKTYAYNNDTSKLPVCTASDAEKANKEQ